jgi:choline dehydrogenase-like flavoprotein
VGQHYQKLDGTRTRFFGGSTNCWAGFCRPLDPIDFTERAWVPHSGWPFGRRELDPYYARAHVVLKLGSYDYDAAHWGGDDAVLQDGPLRNHVFQYGDGPIRMGSAYRDELRRAPGIRVLLHANAVGIELGEGGGAVEGIRAQCLGGPAFRVSARRYILAAGGIENPRLLLASANVQSGGIGNADDLVGRFFMEHPHLRFHATLLARSSAPFEFYDLRKVGEKLARGVLVPREAWLKREKLLNHSIQLRGSDGGEAAVFLRALAAATAETDDWGGDAPPHGAAKLYPLIFHCEQAPNPASRVTLGPEKDPLGMPRVRLDWRLQEIDKRSAIRAHWLAAQALGLARLGRVQVTLDDDPVTWPLDMTGGNHHMGTTRMHRDPKRGVIDERSYVHGVANLLVAGSSVFPTAGAANPTLTIVALALRMADQLKQDLA